MVGILVSLGVFSFWFNNFWFIEHQPMDKSKNTLQQFSRVHIDATTDIYASSL